MSAAALVSRTPVLDSPMDQDMSESCSDDRPGQGAGATALPGVASGPPTKKRKLDSTLYQTSEPEVADQQSAPFADGPSELAAAQASLAPVRELQAMVGELQQKLSKYEQELQARDRIIVELRARLAAVTGDLRDQPALLKIEAPQDAATHALSEEKGPRAHMQFSEGNVQLPSVLPEPHFAMALQQAAPSSPSLMMAVPWGAGISGPILSPWMSPMAMRPTLMHPFPLMPHVAASPQLSPTMPAPIGTTSPFLFPVATPDISSSGSSSMRLSPRQNNVDSPSSSESDPSSPNPSQTPRPPKPARSPELDSSKLLALALATSAGSFVPPPTAGGPVQLEVYHKPRGSQGEWRLVYQGQNLRVTKQRGKLVRLVVRSPTRYEWDSCRVKLLIRSGEDELVDGGELRPRWVESTAREALAVDKRQVTEERDPDNRGMIIYVHQLAVKVFPTRSTLAFRIECSHVDRPENTLVTTSVEMHTHDSGRRD